MLPGTLHHNKVYARQLAHWLANAAALGSISTSNVLEEISRFTNRMIRTTRSDLHFHILDAGSIWVMEFASALSELTPTTAWAPSLSKVGYWQNWERIEQIDEPTLELTRFPLQRGYARKPMARLLPFERKLLERLKARSRRTSDSTLVCTTPFYAPVAERWPGPVVYYVTDLTKKYEGCDEEHVTSLDVRLCNVATVVCPNSRRIANYLIERSAQRQRADRRRCHSASDHFYAPSGSFFDDGRSHAR